MLLRVTNPLPVFDRQRVVVDDHTRESALGFKESQALEVRDETFEVFPKEVHANPLGADGQAPEGLLHELPEVVESGQGEVEVHLDVVELGLAGKRGADEDERSRRAREFLSRLTQLTKRGGVVQVCLRVLEKPDAVRRVRADTPQRRRQVGSSFVGRTGGRESAPHAPRDDRQAQLSRDRAHGRFEPLLFHGLADDEWMAGPEEKRQVFRRNVQVREV